MAITELPFQSHFCALGCVGQIVKLSSHIIGTTEEAWHERPRWWRVSSQRRVITQTQTRARPPGHRLVTQLLSKVQLWQVVRLLSKRDNLSPRLSCWVLQREAELMEVWHAPLHSSPYPGPSPPVILKLSGMFSWSSMLPGKYKPWAEAGGPLTPNSCLPADPKGNCRNPCRCAHPFNTATRYGLGQSSWEKVRILKHNQV